jgi:hypothetical protein
MKIAIPILALLAALGPSATASAKTLCVRTTATPGNAPSFYVMKKIKLKPGAAGPVHGYLIRESDSHKSPIYGSYAAFEGTALFAVTVAGGGLGPQGGGYSYGAILHNFGVATDGTEGDYALNLGDGTSTTQLTGDTTVVDCQTVPKFP